MLAVIAATLLQGTAPTAQPSTIVNPDWQRFPNAHDIGKYYPKAALKEDLAGRATISCVVDLEGRLTGCQAIWEAPIGEGFGEAAVAASEIFRMRPQTKDGMPVAGGTVKIPIAFLMPANLRSGPVRAKHPEVKAEMVELDCRFRDKRLDNCFARGASTPKAMQVAFKAAEEVVLPSLPTRRRQGRIVLPVVFVDASGGVSTPDLVTWPVWHERPTLAAIYRAYPEAARKGSEVGNVVVECRMAARGELEGCGVTSEAPAGQGFGEAALTLIPRFKADQRDGFGLNVEGRKVRIPIRLSPVRPPTGR